MLVYFYINFFFSAFFFFCIQLKTIVLIQWTSLLNSSFEKSTHLKALLDCNEFENCFKDSGYWDFFLLVYFDYMFRVFWIFSLVKASEFSITEKSSWLIFGAVFHVWKSYFYFELASITEFFYFCVILLILGYSLSFFVLSAMLLV